MFDVEAMQSGACEFGITPSCLDHPAKPVSSGAHNSPWVNAVKVVIGGPILTIGRTVLEMWLGDLVFTACVGIAGTPPLSWESMGLR